MGPLRTHWRSLGAIAAVLGALFLGSLLHGAAFAATLATLSRSTTIALTSDQTRLVVINREANSVSIIRVKDTDSNDVKEKLAEIAVGLEPRCLAVHPDDEVAYVTTPSPPTCRSSA